VRLLGGYRFRPRAGIMQACAPSLARAHRAECCAAIGPTICGSLRWPIPAAARVCEWSQLLAGEVDLVIASSPGGAWANCTMRTVRGLPGASAMRFADGARVRAAALSEPYYGGCSSALPRRAPPSPCSSRACCNREACATAIRPKNMLTHRPFTLVVTRRPTTAPDDGPRFLSQPSLLKACKMSAVTRALLRPDARFWLATRREWRFGYIAALQLSEAGAPRVCLWLASSGTARSILTEETKRRRCGASGRGLCCWPWDLGIRGSTSARGSFTDL